MINFRSGNVILKSKPFAHVICASKRQKVCEACYKRFSGSGFRPTCLSCGMVVYCSQNCRSQADDILEFNHEWECKILRAVGFLRYFVDDKVRLILRIWIKLQNSSDEEMCEIVPTVPNHRRSYHQLLDHAEAFERDSAKLLLEYWLQLQMLIKNENNGPTWDQFVSLYGKVMVNSFSLKSNDLTSTEAVGTGLYLGGSYFDHSCRPNARADFRANEIVILATEDILADDDLNNIKLCYINQLEDTASRRRHLQTIWNFLCNCDLCLDVASDLSRHAIACSRCGSPRPIDLDKMVLVEEPDTALYNHSQDCKKVGFDASQDKGLLRLYGYLRKSVSTNPDLSSLKDLTTFARSMAGVFHSLDSVFIKSCLELHETYFESGKWAEAKEFGELALPGMEHYLSNYSEALGSLFLRLGKCCLEINDGSSEEGKTCQDKGKAIFNITALANE